MLYYRPTVLQAHVLPGMRLPGTATDAADQDLRERLVSGRAGVIGKCFAYKW